jgi:hypothetical protein
MLRQKLDSFDANNLVPMLSNFLLPCDKISNSVWPFDLIRPSGKTPSYFSSSSMTVQILD